MNNSYEQEAKEKWGDTQAYKQSQERVAKLTPEQWEEIKKEGDELMKELAASMSKDPASPEVQALIEKHYNSLRRFYEPNLEMYRGLAQMYVEDERFGAYFEKYSPRLTRFIHDAILEYCERNRWVKR